VAFLPFIEVGGATDVKLTVRCIGCFISVHNNSLAFVVKRKLKAQILGCHRSIRQNPEVGKSAEFLP